MERSRDARTFAAIGTLAGAGTSPARHDYTLLDARLPAGAPCSTTACARPTPMAT